MAGKFITPRVEDGLISKFPMLARWIQRVSELLNNAIYGNVADQTILGTLTVDGDLDVDGNIDAETAAIGDGTNQSVFEADGTLRFDGDATTFDDLPPSFIAAQKFSGAGADPALTTFIGNTKQYTFAVNDLVANLNTEFLHKYKEGTNADIHVHFVTNGTDVNDRTVKFQVEHTEANGSTDFSYAFPSTTTASAEITIPANTPDRSHCILPLTTITGTSLKIGAYSVLAFSRIASSGTEPTSDPFVMAVGYHIEQDTTGSRTLYVK